MFNFKLGLAAVSFAAIVGFCSSASAAQLVCDGGGNSGTFSVTTDPTPLGCGAAGGNVNGDNNDSFLTANPGWVTIDINNENNDWLGGNGELTGIVNGTTSGSFSITPPAGYLIALVFKAGNGWVAFFLADGVTSGDWTSTKGISHANIYGSICETCGNTGGEVPLPGAVWLMGTVIAGGYGAMRLRRRRQTKTA